MFRNLSSIDNIRFMKRWRSASVARLTPNCMPPSIANDSFGTIDWHASMRACTQRSKLCITFYNNLKGFRMPFKVQAPESTTTTSSRTSPTYDVYDVIRFIGSLPSRIQTRNHSYQSETTGLSIHTIRQYNHTVIRVSVSQAVGWVWFGLV
jgi:hypothetical protein